VSTPRNDVFKAKSLNDVFTAKYFTICGSCGRNEVPETGTNGKSKISLETQEARKISAALFERKQVSRAASSIPLGHSRFAANFQVLFKAVLRGTVDQGVI